MFGGPTQLSQGVLSVCALLVYNFLVSFFLRKSDTEFLLASLKTLHYLVKPLFRELVVADGKPPVTVNLALKPDCIAGNFFGNPLLYCIGRRSIPPTNGRKKESQTEISMRLSIQILELVRVS